MTVCSLGTRHRLRQSRKQRRMTLLSSRFHWALNEIGTSSPPALTIRRAAIEIMSDKLMRVLVVEDEKKTASFVRKALQAEGHAVDVIQDGTEALVAVANTPFDVVVL